MSWIRHTVVVLAGITSVTLTGAAASVILPELGHDLPMDNIFDLAAPPVERQTKPKVEVVERAPATTLVSRISRPEEPLGAADPAALFTIVPTEAEPSLAAAVKVEDYYVEASVERLRTKVVGFDLTTNLFDLIPEFIKQFYDLDPATTGPTEIHSEHDLRRGEMAVTASDPEVGVHTIEIERKNAVG